MAFAAGLPAPWPALESVRSRIGASARLRGLQRGRELERVGGRHAVVVVPSREGTLASLDPVSSFCAATHDLVSGASPPSSHWGK
jgi:hypothetical protein